MRSAGAVYLVTLRRERRLTQTELARLCELAQTTVSKLERFARSRPTYDVVEAIAGALKVPAASLRWGPDPRFPRPPRLRTRRDAEAEAVP